MAEGVVGTVVAFAIGRYRRRPAAWRPIGDGIAQPYRTSTVYPTGTLASWCLVCAKNRCWGQHLIIF